MKLRFLATLLLRPPSLPHPNPLTPLPPFLSSLPQADKMPLGTRPNVPKDSAGSYWEVTPPYAHSGVRFNGSQLLLTQALHLFGMAMVGAYNCASYTILLYSCTCNILLIFYKKIYS